MKRLNKHKKILVFLLVLSFYFFQFPRIWALSLAPAKDLAHLTQTCKNWVEGEVYKVEKIKNAMGMPTKKIHIKFLEGGNINLGENVQLTPLSNGEQSITIQVLSSIKGMLSPDKGVKGIFGFHPVHPSSGLTSFCANQGMFQETIDAQGNPKIVNKLAPHLMKLPSSPSSGIKANPNALKAFQILQKDEARGFSKGAFKNLLQFYLKDSNKN